MSGGPIEVVSESVVVGKSSSSMSAEKEMRKVKSCVITLQLSHQAMKKCFSGEMHYRQVKQNSNLQRT